MSGFYGSIAADAGIHLRMPGLCLTSVTPHSNTAARLRWWGPVLLCLNAGNAGNRLTFTPLSGGKSQGSRASKRLQTQGWGGGGPLGCSSSPASEPRTIPGINQHPAPEVAPGHQRSAQVLPHRCKSDSFYSIIYRSGPQT